MAKMRSCSIFTFLTSCGVTSAIRLGNTAASKAGLARAKQIGKMLYLHLFAHLFCHVHLEGLAGKVDYAQFLHNASEIKMIEVNPNAVAQNTRMIGETGVLTIEIPVNKPYITVPVIEQFLK